MGRVRRKHKQDLKYDMQTPLMGRRELELSKKALHLLRQDQNYIFSCCPKRFHGGEKVDR